MPRGVHRAGCLRFLVILAILVAGPILIAPLLPLGSIKPTVESQLSQMLGRNVSVGSMKLSLTRGPSIVIENMTAVEDPAFGQGNTLEAGKVRAELAIAPIFRRRLVIRKLVMESPNITFAKNESGVWSWTTLGRQVETGSVPDDREKVEPMMSTAVSPAFLFQGALAGAKVESIDGIRIEHASIRFVDRSSANLPDSLYRDVTLESTLNESPPSRHATGRLQADSDGDGVEKLLLDMPFDLMIGRSGDTGVTASGRIGPGRLESRNFAASSLQSNVNLAGSVLTLDPLEISLYDGTLSGKAVFDMSRPETRFSASGEAGNIDVDQAFSSRMSIPGQFIGHIGAKFDLSGDLRSFQQALPTITGSGHVSSTGLTIASVNLSQNVASALHLNQIGDMQPGTSVGHLESDFQMGQGVIRTNGLRIDQVDGLGDATADQGTITMVPQNGQVQVVLDYPAVIALNSDATSQVKSGSPVIGAAASFFETNNRITLPVRITGEIRNPQVQVDVQRLFQFLH